MSFKGKVIEKRTVIYWGLFLLVLGLTAFISFYHLDVKYVDPYDEARHGVNAYEMLREGKLLESTYGYETDYYNLKPPLSMWCIMLSFLLLGKNVLALRAYSALCYLILIICAGLFVKRNYGKTESLFAMSFLAVNTAPFEAHMIRAGDADSLYVLFFTLAMLCMLEIPQKQNRLYLCGLFFSLAFLTKSFHAALIVVIGGLYLLFAGELKKIKCRTMLRFLAASCVPIVVWAVMRMRVDGLMFMKQMVLVDVLGRTSGALNNNQQPFGWYTQYFLGTMSGKLMVYLWAFMICAIGAVYDSHLFTRQNYRRVVGYLLWIFVPYLAFSAVTNKLIWYMYPVTIPLLMCAGLVIGRLVRERKLAPAVRILLFMGACCILAVYGIREFQTIRAQGSNEFQQLVAQTAAEQRGQVDIAYIAFSVEESDANQSVNTTWAQQDVYLAEVYGDWRCDDGGLDAFSKNMSCVLFLSKDYAERPEVARELENSGISVEIRESDHYVAYIKH